MDSRIKENPERTFDLVVQVACPASENEDPSLLWSFPQDVQDQEVLQTIPKFCFPFDVERVSQSPVGQNFTFVLTDIESQQRFGFCRLTQGCRVCICLLSYLPWFEIFYKLLNTLADYLTKQQSVIPVLRRCVWASLAPDLVVSENNVDISHTKG